MLFQFSISRIIYENILDIVTQTPTLEEKVFKRMCLQLAAMAIKLSGLVLTVIIVVRAALRVAVHDPQGAEKITRIRKGIILR